jgi:DNA (cytosine-5)-methyltransferase 1
MRILDLFCGAGGAAMGYHQAGFEVVGVDINPQPNYPFEFIQADAFEVFSVIGGRFDLIHASPPCQRYSTMQTKWKRRDEHPDYIAELRDYFFETPYIIENVVGAPLESPITLCGGMFNLHDSKGRNLRRHRLFESNMNLVAPTHIKHTGQTIGVYGNTGGSSKRDGLVFGTLDNWREAMGIDWMNSTELREAIPPAYTKYLGEQFRRL